MNNRSLIAIVFCGALAASSAVGCTFDADIGIDAQGDEMTSGAGGSGDVGGCVGGAGGVSTSGVGGSGGFGEGGVSTSGVGGFGQGGASMSGAGGAGGVSEGSFNCGDLVCDAASTFCQVILPGLPGSDPTYSCKPIPEECSSDISCECISPYICANPCENVGGCGEYCSIEADGSITGTCALP